jgi:hypothetical protein
MMLKIMKINLLPPRSRFRTPEKEPILNEGPAHEEEPIAEEEKESSNEDPPVKPKPAFNIPQMSVRLDRLVFNLDGSTNVKKKAQDADF